MLHGISSFIFVLQQDSLQEVVLLQFFSQLTESSDSVANYPYGYGRNFKALSNNSQFMNVSASIKKHKEMNRMYDYL
jgi:UDP-N-acetylglucosamine pyrophosphorylase